MLSSKLCILGNLTTGKRVENGASYRRVGRTHSYSPGERAINVTLYLSPTTDTV